MAPKWKQYKCPSIGEWGNIMQFLYNGILFGNVKEWSTAACLQHDEPQRHVKWKKPGEKCHILYDSIFVKCLEKTNLLKKRK